MGSIGSTVLGTLDPPNSKMASVGSIGSILFGFLEVQVKTTPAISRICTSSKMAGSLLSHRGLQRVHNPNHAMDPSIWTPIHANYIP